MFEATMTSKGQTTIPKDIRDVLGIKSGDRITFTQMSDGTVIMRAKTKSLADIAGALHKEGMKPVAIERMTPWQ
ncbi:type II toxin-antitoxin system PrlF family antitoxin [Methylotenera sp.]|uniref:AbrB/MazE/SpoVT family DNA-binding domain-containing protein n=1 Tax=Methylotenera sp. TaxID=2051956 RepID=UPI0027353945|nr:type II toxin-antitoxin system PrlF family antitoxin [Methylotenera sp.]MDP3210654.1 type II toxin-antitoxin system PrlF family antitoxin [Methylotenera sp.]